MEPANPGLWWVRFQRPGPRIVALPSARVTLYRHVCVLGALTAPDHQRKQLNLINCKGEGDGSNPAFRVMGSGVDINLTNSPVTGYRSVLEVPKGAHDVSFNAKRSPISRFRAPGKPWDLLALIGLAAGVAVAVFAGLTYFGIR